MNGIKPLYYRIHLEPDLQTFDLPGKTEIQMEIPSPVKEIVLNAMDMEILRCRVSRNGSWHDVVFSTPDPNLQAFLITLDRETQGELKLLIDHKGSINDSMLGFYRSRYLDKDGVERYLAVTQFEENEARKAFPGFDHPGKKAVFDIEMVVDRKFTAVSNMPVEEESDFSPGKKLVRFSRTPMMSTYLLFFGVGDFEIMERKGKTLLRALTTPGKIDLAAQGLEFAGRCLEFLEQHFATPYPLPKLDLIAVPDFAFGAMENWGAMTFRENLMLVYPGITSRTALKRLFGVIAHEIVHQWFGDLVSPADWKYLWLNESFATLYGDLAVDHFYPEWSVIDSFILEITSGALGRDSLKANFAVELEEEARITAATAPIIYDKGGSVLRMALDYLGENVGVALKDYFVTHAYQSTVSSDLWKAFGRAGGNSSLSDMMRSWVEQPGHPVIEVTRTGDVLSLKQERFCYLPDDGSDQKWIIPLTVLAFSRSGEKKIEKHLMTAASAQISLPLHTSSFKLNPDQAGFFLVKYEESEFHRIGQMIADHMLDPRDRYGIQEDYFALVRRGDFSAAAYLEFLNLYFTGENHPLPLRGMLKNLSLIHRVVPDKWAAASAEIGRTITEGILSGIGFEPDAKEAVAISALRGTALWNGVLFESRRIREFCLTKFWKMEQGGDDIHPDLAEVVFRAAAFCDEKTFHPIMNRFLRSESEQERMNLAVALGCVAPESAQISLDFALDKIPPALRFIPPYVMSSIPSLGAVLWDIFLKNREKLEALHPSHFERILIGIIASGGLTREKEVNQFFSSYAPAGLGGYRKYLQQSIDMALEILESLTALRRRSQ